MHIAKTLVAAAVVLALPASANAGLLPGLNLHGTAATFSCGFMSGSETCEDINPNSSGSAEQIEILLTGLPGGIGNGASAIQFGIDYASTGVANAFVTQGTCNGAFQVIPLAGPKGEAWPASGSGVAAAFGGCVMPLGEDGIIPVFYLYTISPPAMGTMTLVPDPQAGELVFTDCDAFTNDITKVGEFDFAGTDGFVNCFPPPATEEVTWGRIKSEF